MAALVTLATMVTALVTAAAPASANVGNLAAHGHNCVVEVTDSRYDGVVCVDTWVGSLSNGDLEGYAVAEAYCQVKGQARNYRECPHIHLQIEFALNGTVLGNWVTRDCVNNCNSQTVNTFTATFDIGPDFSGGCVNENAWGAVHSVSFTLPDGNAGNGGNLSSVHPFQLCG
jgi:hypothetical protein